MLATTEKRIAMTGITMRDDEIDELLADWYDFTLSYRPKLGYGRTDAACNGFRASRQWEDIDERTDRAEAALRKRTCEAVEACVMRLDLRARVAIQTEMRNRFSGAVAWSSIRLPGDLDDEYARAKRLLEPLFVTANLIDRACKLD